MMDNSSILFEGYIEAHRAEIIHEIQKLVRIKSVEEKPEEGKPFGEGPYKALTHVLHTGKKMGFPCKNFDGYAGHIEYGEGYETLGVLVHVDVVPEGENWVFPPYSARIEDGKMYGRGAYDDKGACIAAMYALQAVKESNLPLQRKIRIIIGANEETGMKDIPYYLEREKEPDLAFSPDAPFPAVYGEKGILELVIKKKLSSTKKSSCLLSLGGGSSAKVVPGECTAVLKLDEEKRRTVENSLKFFNRGFGYHTSYDSDSQEMTIIIEGKEAYATKPEEGKNAISGMMYFLSEIDFIGKELLSFLHTYIEKIGEEYDGTSLNCNFADDISTPLTFNIGTIKYSVGTIEMKAHIRYPIKTSHEDILKSLRSSLAQDGIEVEIEKISKPLYVEKNSFLVQTLMKVYREATGDTSAQPVTMTGGTYARTMKNAVAFGPLFPGEDQVAHSPNEYLNIESIIKATKIYAKAMYELAK